jgi:EAL domain-containing protein (putative c-di-GMP-specific phosphodiesterase class I)/CheY-like chemotaxis protein
MPREHILVVDDSTDAAEFVAEVCETMGCAVEIAGKWDVFLERYARFDPRVIVLDLILPDVDGVEILHYLGARGATASIVLVSGADPQTIDSARRLAESHNLHVTGVLQKPIDLRSLRQALRAALDRAGRPETTLGPRAVSNSGDPPGVMAAAEVRRAISEGEIVPYYQPKVRLHPDPSIDAVEILARWNHPEHGLLGPAAFVPIVEQDRELASEMTLTILNHALRDLASVPREPPLDLSINLPVACIDDHVLPERLAVACGLAGVERSRLTVEVTEHTRISAQFDAAEVLTRFRLKGFGLSMDDYGTGYSTLAQLVRLPFNELKVDQAFVADIGRHKQSELVIESTVAMAHRLGLEVCAEGVETLEALRFVRAAGCDTMQGFFVSRALPIDGLRAFLSRWHASDLGLEG